MRCAAGSGAFMTADAFVSRIERECRLGSALKSCVSHSALDVLSAVFFGSARVRQDCVRSTDITKPTLFESLL